jgi:hypothetical protein
LTPPEGWITPWRLNIGNLRVPIFKKRFILLFAKEEKFELVEIDLAGCPHSKPDSIPLIKNSFRSGRIGESEIA